jgi:hypothetical protein
LQGPVRGELRVSIGVARNPGDAQGAGAQAAHDRRIMAQSTQNRRILRHGGGRRRKGVMQAAGGAVCPDR